LLAVGITSDYELHGSGFDSQYMQEVFFPKRADQVWGLPSLLFNGYRPSFQGMKLPGRDVDHSLNFSGEDKNQRSSSSAPPLCLYATEKDKFTFFLMFMGPCIVKIF